MGLPNYGGLKMLEYFRPFVAGQAGGAKKLCLIKTAFTESADREWGDLVEADYKGYARKELGIMDIGQAVMLDSVPTLPMSLTLWTFDVAALTGEDSNALYGWAIIEEQPDDDDGNPVDPKLVAARRWPDGSHGEVPIEISDAQPAIQFAPRIVYRYVTL